MKAYRIIQTALRALRRNPMRAALTTLGIVIGVGAVIAMMEIGNGSSKAIQKSIASMGANNLLIHPGTAASGGVSFGSGSVMTLTPEDAQAILRECPAVRTVAPVVRARTQVVYGNHNWVPFSIYGTSRCVTGAPSPKAKSSRTATCATPTGSACWAKPLSANFSMAILRSARTFESITCRSKLSAC